MSKPKQECTDHYLWQKHLIAASWLLILAFWVVFLMGGSIMQLAVILAINLIVLGARLHIDRKHYKWHLSQDSGEHHM